MNNVIETMKNHRSIRHYLDKQIPDDMLIQIIKAAQSMPTSMNGQQLSVIVVKNKEMRQKMATLTGLGTDQVWISEAPVFLVFVADFYRTHLAAEKNGRKQTITESVEASLVGAVDVGIAMGGAIAAAESLGLGIVPIGAVRKNPAEIIRLLELPEYTYPVAGLVVGYPNGPSALKPRFALEAFAHKEVYDKQGAKKAIDEYDERMTEYYKTRDNKDTNWSDQISEAYQSVYFPEVYPTMKSQGFLNNK